jgi:sulfoxide reductase heme-binding subunit YedZ
VIWPWQDRNRHFSWLKAGTFALMLAPAVSLIHDLATGEFGPVPLGGLTYWSGLWATALLLLVLAITPAMTILRWRRLILVRRMVGVAALAYTIAHLFIYFALRLWNFSSIANEMATRLSLIVATASTIGLIALGATSLDAAIRRMGARRWQRLHNTVYALTALALLHYLMSPGIFPDQFLLAGLFFWLMAWRVLERRGRGNHAGALALLAVASCGFAALLEIGCLWAFRGYRVPEIFNIYFTLALGIPPAWTILAAGIVIAVAVAIWPAPRAKPIGIDARESGSSVRDQR